MKELFFKGILSVICGFFVLLIGFISIDVLGIDDKNDWVVYIVIFLALIIDIFVIDRWLDKVFQNILKIP